MTPRGPVLTTLLSFTWILFAAHAVMLVASGALAFKRPTEVTISESGVHVYTRTEPSGGSCGERGSRRPPLRPPARDT